MPVFFEPVLCALNGKEFSIEQYSDAALRVPSDPMLKQRINDDEYEQVRQLFLHLNQNILTLDMNTPICVLLPRISCKAMLKRVSSLILSVLNLTTNSQVRFYPYGEASFLMAFNQIQKLSIENKSTWIVALNLGERLSGDIDSYDSLVVARCLVAREGINARGHSIDLETSSLNIAVENVMQQLGAYLQDPIDELLLSIGSGEPKWLESIKLLSSVIHSETKYTLSDVTTGPLGACGGILKILALCYQQQVRGTEDFHALQVDLEPEGYAVGSLLTWCSE
ncbi:hypothetical protein ACB087_04755 [Vibrio sp. VNB-15]